MKWGEVVNFVIDYYKYSSEIKIEVHDDSEYLPSLEVFWKGHVYEEGYEFCVGIEIVAPRELVCIASLNGHREHVFSSLYELTFALRDFSKFVKVPSPEQELCRIEQEAKESSTDYDPYQ